MTDFVSGALQWVRSPCYIDLTTREIALLGLIVDRPGPHTVRALAGELKVSKPVVTRSVNRLVREGLVIKDRSDSDGRDVHIMPRKAGSALRASFWEAGK